MTHDTGKSYYPGQRLSFSSRLCTVRYIGTVDGTKGIWLGVEWDDPLAGKHSGRHNGKRYFECRSDSPRAASFVRPTRPADKPLSFLAALRKKYAGGEAEKNGHYTGPVKISGKVVEEVGFEKISKQQAILQELKIVLLDGLGVAGLGEEPWLANEKDKGEGHSELATAWRDQLKEVTETCPMITELDLSRSIIERWTDVVGICEALPALRVLTLNGNRFRDFSNPPGMNTTAVQKALEGITDLSLDDTLMKWNEIVLVTSQFLSLRSASLAINNLTGTPEMLSTPSLQSLSLAFNNISSLESLSPLSHLPNLKTLSLNGNALTTLSTCPRPFPQITTLDLSSNSLPTLSALNLLQSPPPSAPLFPALTSLRVSRNLFFTSLPADTAHMLTLARLPLLQILNFSPISVQERANAELFYLSTISAELAEIEAGDVEAETRVLGEHPLWSYLCAKHDYELTGLRKRKGEQDELGPETLGGRLLALKVRARVGTRVQVGVNADTTKPAAAVDSDGGHGSEEAKLRWVERKISVPKTVSVYRLKSVLGHAFSILPVDFEVIWETGEWDPVGVTRIPKGVNAEPEAGVNYKDNDEESKWEVGVGSDDESERTRPENQDGLGEYVPGVSGKGRWVKREIEVVEGTSSVGFWIEGKEATLRLEMAE